MPSPNPKSQTKPVVAIVGRPNVGKSAIFNRFAGRRISIVHDQPGVTRDRIAATCEQGALPFEVIDTGGIGAALEDSFGEQVRAEADLAIQAADLILFVVDGQSGMTSIDDLLASELRRARVEVMLVVNKVDDPKHENMVADFAVMGFDDPFPVSAEHGRNFDKLIRKVGNRLGKRFEKPEISEEEARKEPIRIAMAGRPNVGKSSLINAVLEDERTIVSDIAGTTRDAVDVPYQRGGIPYTLIDTAGIRKRTRRDSPVEVFSVMRSERSIRRADLCLLVIDSARGVTAMDRKIARIILDEHKPCLIILNKFDLFHPEGPFRDRIEELEEHVREELFFLHYAPMVAVSALKSQYINKIFGAIEKVRMASLSLIGTGELNRLLKGAIQKNPPPAKQGKRLNLLYATCKRSDHPRPVEAPRIMLFVNYANLIPRTYERYLDAAIRKHQQYPGLPIEFLTRSRRSKE